MERNVTTMRGIQYDETFIDFLVISTLAVRWITLNLARSTIRLLRKVRNKNDTNFDLFNVDNFYDLISK